MKRIWVNIFALPFLCFSAAAQASSNTSLANVTIPNTQDALRRGAETVVTLCASCHSLNYIRYRDLAGLGILPETLEEWGSQGELNSTIASYASTETSRETFGVVSPDLSMMALARKGGARYFYTLLTAYHETPDGEAEIHFFPGIAMPDVLGYSAAESDAEKTALEDQAKDIAAFLEWAADPSAPFRQQLGFIVMGVLGVQTCLFYVWKKRVRRRLDKATDHADGHA